MKMYSHRIAPIAVSVLALAISLSACAAPPSADKDKPTFVVPQNNANVGAAFLAENAKKAGIVTTASGLQYEIVRQGTGPKPRATDTVKVNYVGTLLDGTEFDNSANNGGPASFPVDQVIPGWTEGLQLMPVGSKFTFWIPAKLAYGTKGAPGSPIKPDATLKFDVELLSTGAQ